MNRTFCLRILPVFAPVLFLLSASPARSQRIPQDEYLKFVPLDYPRLMEQTPASSRLSLYGDPASPGFVDENPRDGVDDRRGRFLDALALRFAPYMIQNTVALPMDAFATMRSPASIPLYIDRWNLARPGAQYLETTTLALAELGPSGPDGDTELTRENRTRTSAAFERLMTLFAPENPQHPRYRSSTASPILEVFDVLYFEYPGEGPASWQKEFENFISRQLNEGYRPFERIYVHPFLHETSMAGEIRYELVMQYWFFYPFNNGGNNHYGDWEHINVVVSPRSKVTSPMTEEDVRSLLALSDPNAAPDPLIIRRVEYYFHSQVMPVDYSSPNVYLSRSEWEQAVKTQVEQRLGQEKIWRIAREYAYWDEEETVVNTHPICFIGADNKGLDQILAPPGPRNRDSHGTYPFPGLFKDIGPGGATETIASHFPLKEYWGARQEGRDGAYQTYKRGGLVRFDDPAKIRMLPDWERFYPLLAGNPGLQLELGWMILPVRFGYPAVQSPFAGVVSHAETGNLAVFGPSYNSGWNAVAGMGGFSVYEPHAFPDIFPLGWQDSFNNSWGVFNLTIPTLVSIPPLDFVFRGLLAPIKAATGTNSPILYPKDNIPFRFVSLSVGQSQQGVPEEFLDLFFNQDQAEELIFRLFLADTLIANSSVSTVDNETAKGLNVQAVFHVGSRFASQNVLRHSNSHMNTTIFSQNRPDGVRVDADLNMWEYAGSLRYNLATQLFQPFLKLGYGITWYRLENCEVDRQPMDADRSPWFNRPTFSDLASFLPDGWSFGAGVDLLVIRNYGTVPGGIDLAVKAEWGLHTHKLGIDEDVQAFGLPLGVRNSAVSRSVFDFAVSVGF